MSIYCVSVRYAMNNILENKTLKSKARKLNKLRARFIRRPIQNLMCPMAPNADRERNVLCPEERSH